MVEKHKKQSSPIHKEPQVQTYLNYREYLKDFFNYQKSVNSKFSHAFFANKCGFKSKTFIFKVIQGDKKLSGGSIFQVAEAIGLSKQAQEYFSLLIYFNDSKSMEEKILFYKKLSTINKKSRIPNINIDQFEYFSNWYNPVLREVITFEGIDLEFEKLGKLLEPTISAKEVKSSIDLMLRLNLLKKNGNKFEQSNELVSTGESVKEIAVQKFQKENLKLAGRALDKFSKQKEISTLTFGANEEGFNQIKEEIIQFRKRLINLILAQKDLDRVCQLNFQLFPLTRSVAEK